MKTPTLIILFLVSVCSESIAQNKNTDFDIKKGAEAAKQIAESVKVDTTSTTAKYLQAVGNRLAGNLENKLFDYSFHLVDMSEPNAFALPGGYIYVTRGILVLLNDEDELAGIMGHEIIHSQNRHSYKASKKGVLPAVLMAPGNVVGLVNEDLGSLINAPINLTSALRLAKYGRQQESEADTYGIQLAAKSGYDPLALTTALENLTKTIEYLTGNKMKFSYFDDHPFTPDRVKNIEETSKNLSSKDQPAIAPVGKEFLNIMSGTYIGEHPEQGVFDKNRFYHADLDLDIRFPEGWEVANKSSYVAAQQPDGDAVVYMIVLPGNASPKEYAEAFIEKFRKKYRVESFRAEELDINGYPGYAFGVDEMDKGQVNNSTIIWVKKGDLVYQIVGSGLKKYEKEFENTARSIKGLTDETRAKVTGIVLKVVEAKEGESLMDLSSRSGNVLNLEYLALINNYDPNEALKSGQFLKIGVMKQYIPESGQN